MGSWEGQCVEEQNLFFLFLVVAWREQEQVKEGKREGGREKKNIERHRRKAEILNPRT